MAADIGADVMLAEFALDQLHRGEERAFRTTGAEAGGALRHFFRQRGVGQQAASAASGIARPLRQKLRRAVLHDLSGVFAGARKNLLADDARLEIGAAQDRVEFVLDEFGLALLDDQHRALAGAEVRHLVGDQRIGDVEHIDRQLRCFRTRRTDPSVRARG